MLLVLFGFACGEQFFELAFCVGGEKTLGDFVSREKCGFLGGSGLSTVTGTVVLLNEGVAIAIDETAFSRHVEGVV